MNSPLSTTSPAVTRGRPRDPARDQLILKAARDLLAERGFTGMSMDEVARTAGVGKDTLYRRWSNKEDLVAQVLATIAEEGVQPHDLDDPRMALFLFLQDIVQLNCESNFGAIVAGVVGESARNPSLAAVFHQFWQDRRQLAAHLVRQIVGGYIPQSRLDAILDGILSPIYYRLLLSGAPTPPEYLWELIISIPWSHGDPGRFDPERPDMNNREHILAVVDPSTAGEAPLTLARNLVDQGAKATVLLVVAQPTHKDIVAYADAEDLGIGEAEDRAVQQFTTAYAERVGGDDTEFVLTHTEPSTADLLSAATAAGATLIALPNTRAHGRGWKSLTETSTIPVVIAPGVAA